MEQKMLSFIIIQIILVLVGISIIFYAIKQYQRLKLEKRFESFSLVTNNDHEISIFDGLANYVWKLIHKVSTILKKSQVLCNYSKRYERHISVEEKELKEGMDYISMKFFIASFFVLLNIITIAFQLIRINPMSFIITFLIGFFLPDIVLKIKFKKKRKQIEEDLLKAIIIMNNSFKSGRNIMQAIATVKNELDGPIADEFKKIYLDINYGLSLEVVFNRFYERVKLEDAKYIASSLTLLNKTGGNIVKVFENIEKSFYNKKKLYNELNSLTAASVFVFRVLVALPFVFTLIIYILNPTYFSPLFASKIGFLFLFVIILLFSIYVYTIKKVLKVKI